MADDPIPEALPIGSGCSLFVDINLVEELGPCFSVLIDELLKIGLSLHEVLLGCAAEGTALHGILQRAYILYYLIHFFLEISSKFNYNVFAQ